MAAETSPTEACDELLAEFARADAAEAERQECIDKWEAAGGWRTIRRGGRIGLQNLRNTCYLNSVVQLLAHLSPFTAYMLSTEDGDHDVADDQPAIADRLREVLRALWQEPHGKSVDPRRLHNALMRLAPWFIRKGVKEDALDLFTFLLNRLHEEMVSDKATADEDEKLGGPPPTQDLTSWIQYLARVKSPIVSLFQGRLQTVVTCMECGHTSSQSEDFLHLSVPVLLDMDGSPGIYLQDALASLTNEELLTGPNCWECDRCGMKVEATRKVQIDHLPAILIVHLLRFTYNPLQNRVVKARARVELLAGNSSDAGDRLKGLDLKQHVCQRLQDSALYDIVGIVNHHGRDMDDGHYTVNCRHAVDSSWYKFDDKEVRQVEDSDAYMPDCAYVMALMRRDRVVTLPNPQAAAQ